MCLNKEKKMNIKLTSFEICEARVVYICHVIDKAKTVRKQT